MSLTLALAVTLGGSVVACVVLQVRRSRSRTKLAPPRKQGPLATLGFPVEQGEVLALGDSEYCLNEGYWLHEDHEPLAAVFEVGEERVVVLPGPEREVHLGMERRLELPTDLPPSLQLDSVDFRLRARFPVEVERIAPEPGPRRTGLWARYLAAGGTTLWVLRVGVNTTAIRTQRVHPGAIFSWGTPTPDQAP